MQVTYFFAVIFNIKDISNTNQLNWMVQVTISDIRVRIRTLKNIVCKTVHIKIHNCKILILQSINKILSQFYIHANNLFAINIILTKQCPLIQVHIYQWPRKSNFFASTFCGVSNPGETKDQNCSFKPQVQRKRTRTRINNAMKLISIKQNKSNS